MTFLKCSIQGVKYGEAIPEDKDKEIVVSTGEVLQEKKPDSPSSVSLKIGIGCHGARVKVVALSKSFYPGSVQFGLRVVEVNVSAFSCVGVTSGGFDLVELVR